MRNVAFVPIICLKVFRNNIHHSYQPFLFFLKTMLKYFLISVRFFVPVGPSRKYMEIGRHRGIIANAHIKIGSNSYEKVKTFKYLGSLLTNQNSIQEEIKCRLKAGNSCYYSVQTLLSSRLLLRI